MKWADAHRIAMIEATHAHSELGYQAEYPVDVFDAIAAHDLVLGFEGFPRLSGVYVSEPGAAGIAINAGHGLARQRYTAAHELAHHRFGHGTTVDFDIDPLHAWSNGSEMNDRERLAEAFAAWFLMPRKLVLRTLEAMGLPELTAPSEVYQLALRLGASYRATCRHLVNLRLLAPFTSREWVKITPRSLKLALLNSETFDLHQDVWVFGPGDRDQRYFARPGDRVLLELPEVPSSGYTWQLLEPPVGTTLVDEQLIVAGSTSGHEGVGQACVHRVELTIYLPEQVARQLRTKAADRLPATLQAKMTQPWQPDAPADRFALHLDIRPGQRGINAASLQPAA